MSGSAADKARRRGARDTVGVYHATQLAELVAHVGEAIDEFRAGRLDAFETDEVIFQYSRAAKELWKFCSLGDVEITAKVIDEGEPYDWWERGAPRSPPIAGGHPPRLSGPGAP